jgi:polyhydroxyalkanoate synthesis regulator phasin
VDIYLPKAGQPVKSNIQSLQDRIEALENAVATAQPGVTSVRMRDGSTVNYSSTADMNAEIDRLRGRLSRLKRGNFRPVNLGGFGP